MSEQDVLDHDYSNMGRCDICGKFIDMRDEAQEMVLTEQEAPDVEGIDEQDVADAMARALRHSGTPEDHAAADAYEEHGRLRAHGDCYDETSIPDFPTMGDLDGE